MKKIVKRVCAPVRVDFGGGTTDIKPFTHTHGGAVLNAAINRYVYGTLIATDSSTKLEYHADIPTSSGLGTSSAMNVVWVALITRMKEKKSIAESVFRIEQSISESKVNGKQDMYAAAMGGINYIEFVKDKVIVKKLRLKPNFIKVLNSKLVLVYSGKAHYSGSSNKSMIQNLLNGKNTNNLIRIRDIAKEMMKALIDEDLKKFAGLMDKETEERSKLSKITLSEQLKEIIKKGKENGAVAAKICGSGGGGSILLFTDDKKRVVNHFKSKVIDFRFDNEGLRWM